MGPIPSLENASPSMPLYRLRPALVVVLLGILLAAPLAARQATPAPAGPAQTGEAIRVFLDCNTFCDFDHIRREITYVNWVRDRADADVHLISTSQSHGAGRACVLGFFGLRRLLS